MAQLTVGAIPLLVEGHRVRGVLWHERHPCVALMEREEREQQLALEPEPLAFLLRRAGIVAQGVPEAVERAPRPRMSASGATSIVPSSSSARMRSPWGTGAR